MRTSEGKRCCQPYVVINMNTYNEDESKRKQAMIPLIALFICFLAITCVGVAYAFNSTIQIDKNPVNEQYFTLDYTDKDGGAIADVLEIPTDSKDMTITTSVKVDGDSRTFTATINENVNANITREFYVKLASDMDGQKFKITGTVDKSDTVINAIFGDCTDAFKMYNKSTDAEVDMGSVDANKEYKVILTIPINSNVNVKTIPGLAGASAINDATTLNTALGDLTNHTFTVKMKAELP